MENFLSSSSTSSSTSSSFHFVLCVFSSSFARCFVFFFARPRNQQNTAHYVYVRKYLPGCSIYFFISIVAFPFSHFAISVFLTSFASFVRSFYLHRNFSNRFFEVCYRNSRDILFIDILLIIRYMALYSHFASTFTFAFQLNGDSLPHTTILSFFLLAIYSMLFHFHHSFFGDANTDMGVGEGERERGEVKKS